MFARRSDLSKQILTIVSDIMEIPASDILSKKRDAETVDARHVYIHMLHECGLYPVCISVLSGLTHRQVNNILSGFRNRMRFSRNLGNRLEIIRNKLGNNVEATLC